MEKEAEENRLSREHATRMKQLDIQLKKTELQLRQAEAIRSRKHQQNMKEIEYAIRYQETRWRALLKIPLYIIKLPIYTIIAIGCTIRLATNKEIPTNIIDLLK